MARKIKPQNVYFIICAFFALKLAVRNAMFNITILTKFRMEYIYIVKIYLHFGMSPGSQIVKLCYD